MPLLIHRWRYSDHSELWGQANALQTPCRSILSVLAMLQQVANDSCRVMRMMDGVTLKQCVHMALKLVGAGLVLALVNRDCDWCHTRAWAATDPVACIIRKHWKFQRNQGCAENTVPPGYILSNPPIEVVP